MVNENNIKSRLLKLEQYINDLMEFENIKLDEYRQKKLVRRFIERTLHLTIESCLDIGNHIISEERLGIADSNTDIMKILAENNIIKDNIDTYIKMAKFRNIIVHDYAELDDEIIVNILNNELSVFKQIFNWFQDYI